MTGRTTAVEALLTIVAKLFKVLGETPEPLWGGGGLASAVPVTPA